MTNKYVNKISVEKDIKEDLAKIIKISQSNWGTITNRFPTDINTFLSNVNPPNENINKDTRDNLFLNLSVDDQIQKIMLQLKKRIGAIGITNSIVYPPNSVMKWHTNADNIGIRRYFVFTAKPGIFRYQCPISGKIIDDEDNIGWTGRQFVISKKNPLWHTIWSPGVRFSFGFNFKDIKK